MYEQYELKKLAGNSDGELNDGIFYKAFAFSYTDVHRNNHYGFYNYPVCSWRSH